MRRRAGSPSSSRALGSMELIRFTNSGTEANLMAIATAIAFTGRARDGVRGRLSRERAQFGPAFARSSRTVSVTPLNVIEAARTQFARHAGQLAGVLVGRGWCRRLKSSGRRSRILRAIAEEARAVGTMLIFDEIQTARLSSGGRQALLGIRPDLTTLGKYHGGGLWSVLRRARRHDVALRSTKRRHHLAHAGTSTTTCCR